MRISLRSTALAVAVLGALLIVGTRAEADALKCQRTINKESAKYAQAKMKALSKCEEAILKDKITGPCPDPGDGKAGPKIEQAAAKMKAKIEKACGGADKLCSTTGDNDPLGDIGWDIGECPNVEQPACDLVHIGHCGNIGPCIECVNETAVDLSIALYYGSLAPSTPGDDLNKCQIAIGKETAKFFKAKSKTLQKCEDALLKGKDGYNPLLPCPAADTSGKSQEKLTKAEAKKVAGICKKCGGPDKLCDGVDDFTPAEIGFAANCPAVQIPGGGQDCGAIGTVDTLAELVDCVDCVTEFRADCLDALAVPGIKPYPAECGVCAVTTPTTGPCPTSVQIDVKGDEVDLDTGWTGLSHDANVPIPSRVTLSVDCGTAEHPTCGECDLTGPIANAGGSEFANQRCHGNTSVHCTSDADCNQLRCSGGSNDGALCSNDSECPGTGGVCKAPGGPCRFLFGATLPLSAGGVAVCVSNEVRAPVTGTIDVEAATSVTLVRLNSEVFLGEDQAAPCPRCVAGKCLLGERNGLPCKVSSTSELYGDVSYDCPPLIGANIGHLPITLDLQTGVQTWSLSAESPDCSTSGYTDRKCFCDTCTTAEAEPCASNADCPVGARCGGLRCRGGSNEGAQCSHPSMCPGGKCEIPGQATQTNQCEARTCFPNPSDTDTIDEGVCGYGPTDFLCAIQTYRGCFSNADCQPKRCNGGSSDGAECDVDSECPGGVCEQYVADSCTLFKTRECFTDNGVIGKHCLGGDLRCIGGDNNGNPCLDYEDCAPGVCSTPNNESDTPCTSLSDCPDQSGSAFCGGGGISVSGEPGTMCGLFADATVGSIFCIQHTANGSPNSVSGLPGPGRVQIPIRTTFNQ